jgi:polyphosphate glucokinase
MKRPRASPARRSAHPGSAHLRILVIDVGGRRVKMLVSGRAEPRRFLSGPALTPDAMVAKVRTLARDWRYDAVSIGFPGTVGRDGPSSEPENLGPGWVGYDFSAALDRPVKLANDAAMQALGSYEGGRMLFLGLGTGLGAALISDRTILPVELGELPWERGAQTLGQALSTRGLARSGARRWRRVVEIAASQLMKAFRVDYVVIGGGNAKKLKQLPHGLRRGHNLNAFRGGFRLWSVEDIPILAADAPAPPRSETDWRLL